MKKSLLTAIITCFILTSFVGCSDKSDGKKNDKSSSKAETTTVAEEESAADESEEEEITEDEEISDKKIVIEGMTGKKLSEIENEGYKVNGYSQSPDEFIIYLSNKEYKDDKSTEFLESLKGKTVKELIDKYDISVSYFGFGDEYTFSSYFGSLSVQYDIEHGKEAIDNHKDDDFFDLEDAEEIQSDVLENIELSDISFNLTLDDASFKKLSEVEDVDTDYIKSITDELIVNEIYYTFE